MVFSSLKFVIVVLAILLIAGSLIALYFYTEYSSLRFGVELLSARYRSLDLEYRNLLSRYKELIEEYENMVASYTQLQGNVVISS